MLVQVVTYMARFIIQSVSCFDTCSSIYSHSFTGVGMTNDN